MKNSLLSIVLFTFLSVLGYDASARHVMGGNISWTCLGNDSFLIVAVVYEDCNGSSSYSPGQFTVTSKFDTMQVSATAQKGYDVTPCNISTCSSSSSSARYGIMQIRMTAVVDLASWRKKSACEVDMSWSACCRRGLSTVNSTVMFLEAKMNICVSPCYSAPKWQEIPAMLVCYYKTDTFNNSLIKRNAADSFYYELDTPRVNALQNITYKGTFSARAPLSFHGYPKTEWDGYTKGFWLDSTTGRLRFRPMQQQVAVVTVRVYLFRNGVKMGEVLRNYSVTSFICPLTYPPSISGMNCSSGSVSSNFLTEVIAGDSVDFTICVKGDTNQVSWQMNVPRAKMKILDKNAKNKTVKFSWKTEKSDFKIAPHIFVLSAKNQSCISVERSSRSFGILVRDADTVGLKASAKAINNCGRYQFTVVDTIAGKANLKSSIHWYTNNGNTFMGTGDTIEYTMLSGGTQEVVAHYLGKGKDSFTLKMSIPRVNTMKSFRLNDTTICAHQNLVIDPKISGANGWIKYAWKFTSPLRSLKSDTDALAEIPMNDSAISYRRVYLTNTDSLDCQYSTFFGVKAKAVDRIDLENSFARCENDYTSLKLSYSNFDGIWTGTGMVARHYFIARNHPVGTHRLEYLYSDGNTCEFDTAFATVLPKPSIKMPTDITRCYYSDTIQLKSKPQGIWSGASTTSNGIFTPKKHVLGKNELIATYEASNGCKNEDTMEIQVIDYHPPLNLSDSLGLCKNEPPLILKIKPTVRSSWRLINHVPVDNADSFSVDPDKLLPGFYDLTVSAKDSNECTNSDTSEIWVFSPPPADFVILNKKPVVGDTLKIKNKTPKSKGRHFLWLLVGRDSVFSPLYQPELILKQVGKHKLSLLVTDSLTGCTDTLVRAINDVVVDGPKTVVNFKNFGVYPNPAHDMVFIESRENDGRLKVFSVHGKELLNQDLSIGINKIQLPETAKGLHIFECSSNHKVFRIRVVIE